MGNQINLKIAGEIDLDMLNIFTNPFFNQTTGEATCQLTIKT
jgi:hypothetical protein